MHVNCKLRALTRYRHSFPLSECMACRMACEEHENVVVYVVLPKGRCSAHPEVFSKLASIVIHPLCLSLGAVRAGEGR